MNANDAEQALIDAIVDEALADFARLLQPTVLHAIRGCLQDRLGAHPEGRALLRRALADPQIDASGEVPTEGAEEQRDRAREGTG